MKTETTADETPIRDIGIEIDKRLHKRLGEIGDTYTLIGLAYLEGLNAQERTEKPNIAVSGGGGVDVH